ncbi:DNA helicase-2/ATP-dependent DNA helicase PcrA [Clostridium acetobutylicum]|uniref:DNA 3'-5' helicase n=1 Tax=Clostridium acetobutylicum (strain ATCC 824 / DSM 792 / JCM 1419 / IAM 19013 / LMG 5710 / NBRC 13948 / NRRL B-527 / VKM B-1787 / 2291 / W) TaxID=272562 RepID=Q97KB6_CLOAB|nr:MULTISPECIES: ATP-dependent helicase [Clostridium]AAK78979.1 Superfamily I DNA helicase (rep-like helicase) [Clostridium acetobutylicum ATCC 824]ADZ20053.1 Superfamily I DNA helicase (rep-like helicase) [Clostridium acetobutylicum EA 2018]AEI33607.1 superfamily I DNA helicase [Clostridium acetobutylicum DSM 1731]AWV81765.1 ATP-dependent helicase [Clostridium acetobutylicum]MBC2395308.1 ATP-dependent helicase [Clostridium acetobutylicum]
MISEAVKREFCLLRDKIIEQSYKHLDNMQRNAVFNGGSNCIVVACPGAGKTQVILNRVDYLCKFGPVYNTEYVPDSLKQEDLEYMRDYLNNFSIKKTSIITNRIRHLMSLKKVSTDNIIVITFTKAAAVNMKRRYINYFNSRKTPFFGTFHSLFYKILSRHKGNIKIIEEIQKYNIVKSVLMKYMDEVNDDKLREVINDISSLKCSECSMEDFKSQVDKKIFEECYERYESYKKDNSLMDFDDLQIECMKMFEERPELLRGYSNLFMYVLVDEFQDSDSLQIKLLKMLSEKSSIYAVGDEDQCIYSFRGSRPDCMVDFDKIFKDGRKLFLSTNYRSVRNIVDISKNLIANNEKRNLKDIDANKSDSGKITIINSKNENIEADKITIEIEKLKNISDYNYSDIAILYRTNVESRSLIDSFIRRNIPFKFLDREYNFFEHFICKDIAAYLRLSIDEFNRESFLRIINRPFRYISKVNLQKVKSYGNMESVFDILKNIEDLPIFQIKDIEKLQTKIRNLNKMSLLSAVQFIISDLGYSDYIQDYCKKRGFDVEEMMDIIEEFKSACDGYNNIIKFLSHIEEVREKIKENKVDTSKDTVLLSTIHGVKGMEFKNVFIINCDEENIPHKNSIDENIEEERRLFYVGITRAIENLWISITSELKGCVRKPSRFIKECKLNLNDFEGKYKKGDKVEHVSFGLGEIISIEDEVTEIRFKNDTRRFDTSVLLNAKLMRRCQ